MVESIKKKSSKIKNSKRVNVKDVNLNLFIEKSLSDFVTEKSSTLFE